MPRSVCLNSARRQTALQALRRNGFLTQGELAIHLEMAPSTVSKFFTGKAVYVSKFEQICDTLGLETREMARSADVSPDPRPDIDRPNFLSYDRSWVGREPLVAELCDVLQSRRLLTILGLTGIGKTALAECLIDTGTFDLAPGGFRRANFESGGATDNFCDIAAQWLESWGIASPPEERRPELLRDRLLNYLAERPAILLFDSLETLLQTAEDGGGGTFRERAWANFFSGFLSAERMPSRIIVTSQDLPTEITRERYRHRWHRCILTGLNRAEQIALFDKMGFDTEADAGERDILLRLGLAYRGHPLILRVIAGEIWESFQGNVAAYWHEIREKIEAVERAIAEAEADATKVRGDADEWKLHVLTRRVRLEVNRQRLRSVFERLQSQAPDAYLLLCAASVYRIPVEVKGWTMQLENFTRRLEGKPCDEERQELALEELHHRFLVEEGIGDNNRKTLGQHPLVRSTSLEHYQRSLVRWKEKAADGA